MLIIRKLIKFLIFSFIMLSLACFAAWAYLNSDYAKPQIAQTVGESLSKLTTSKISIGSISFSFPCTFTLNDISLSEAAPEELPTPWIKVKKLHLCISLSDLFNRNVVIKTLELNDVNVLTLPSSIDLNERSSFIASNQVALPPIPLALEEIIVKNVILAPAIISHLNIPPNSFPEGLQLHAAIYPDFLQASLSAKLRIGSVDDSNEGLSLVNCYLKWHENIISTDFKLDEPNNGMIAGLVGHTLPGSLHLEGHAIVNTELLSLRNTYAESIPSKTISGSLSLNVGPDIQGTADFFLLSDNSVNLLINEATVGPLAIQGSVLFSAQQIFDGTKLDISINDVAFLEPWIHHKMRGGLNATCHISGAINDIRASLGFQGSELAYDTFSADQAAGEIEINRTLDQWNGRISLSASLQNIPFQASTQFNWKPKKLLSMTNVSVSALDTIAKGNLTYEQDSEWFTGEIEGSCSNLSAFNQWMPAPINGEASFKAQLLHSTMPSLEMQIEAPNVAYGETSLKNTTLIFSFSDPFNSVQGNVHAHTDLLADKNIILHNVTMSTIFDKRHNAWPMIIDVGDTANDIVSFNAEGYWHLEKNILQLTVEHLKGRAAGMPFAMLNSSSLKVTPNSFELTPFQFNVGEGTAQGLIEYQTSHLLSSIQFENIPLKYLHLNSPIEATQGIISGRATINGPLESPVGNCTIVFKDVKINEHDFANTPILSGNLQVSFNENDCKVSGDVNSATHPTIHLEANLPVALSMLPPQIKINRTAPLSGNIQAAGEITPILQLFFTDTTLLSGKISATATLAGTMEAPMLGGTATITDGAFEILEIGTLLKNVSANFEGSGKQITLKQLSAVDERGGTLTGSGTLQLDVANQFPFALDMDLNNLAVLDQDFAKGAFTGHLLLKGNFAGAALSGKAETNVVTISIPEQTPALMNFVEVTYINQPENEKLPSIAETPAWPLSLDINLTAANNVIIRGRDLNSEWKGLLALTGPASSPIFTGNFKVIRGQYLFNGKDFDINQGSIALDGDLEKKSTTTLYVIASKDLDKVKVEVILKGPVKNPEISFRSNPPLPQREILSWILFNRGTSEISPFQGTQLTESITNLKSNHKGPDVLTKIRNVLGIDRFDISRDENNGNAVSIQVGKYISRNVFISVNKSDVNRIAVEAALMRNIKLQAQVGDDSEGQLLLKWKHDY